MDHKQVLVDKVLEAIGEIVDLSDENTVMEELELLNWGLPEEEPNKRYILLKNILTIAFDYKRKLSAGVVDTIKFYDSGRPYFAFSNFAKYKIEIGDKTWATTEHYYQAMKFEDIILQESVRLCATPKEAAIIGRNKKLPLRQDWEKVKEDYMYAALQAKFNQHPKLKELLLGTGDACIVEDSRIDYYWGNGKSGEGKNRLGELLMKLREELKT